MKAVLLRSKAIKLRLQFEPDNFPVWRTDKIPLGTKGHTSILSYREYRASWVTLFPVSRRKLPDRECCVTLFRQGGYTTLCR